jgi:hypothetical protein
MIVGGGNDTLSTISGSLKGVGDSLSAPFVAGGPFGSFGAGARPSANQGENKVDSHKGHRRSASAADSTAAHSVGTRLPLGGLGGLGALAVRKRTRTRTQWSRSAVHARVPCMP